MQTETKIQQIPTSQLPNGTDFAVKIRQAIEKSRSNGKPFFVMIFQIANLEPFLKRRSQTVVYNLLREIGMTLRRVVHSSQFVGRFQDGFGLVFDAVETGEMDIIAKKLGYHIQNVISSGHYNDLSGKWTEIVFQFLHPSVPLMIYPMVGWAVHPRDGENAEELVKRALCHLKELSR
jgi:GGDEF domain-containing protein